MDNPFPLQWMMDTADDRMFDECYIERHSSTSTDAQNNPIDVYTDEGPYACGYKPEVPREGMGLAQVELRDAVVRLPLSVTPPGRLDRIRVTKRYNVALSPIISYEVMGTPRPGPSALVVDLKKVTIP